MGLKSSQGPWNHPNKMSAVMAAERCGIWSNQMKKAHNLKPRVALLTPPSTGDTQTCVGPSSGS